jgi:hypothetical protein
MSLDDEEAEVATSLSNIRFWNSQNSTEKNEFAINSLRTDDDFRHQWQDTENCPKKFRLSKHTDMTINLESSLTCLSALSIRPFSGKRHFLNFSQKPSVLKELTIARVLIHLKLTGQECIFMNYFM